MSDRKPAAHVSNAYPFLATLFGALALAGLASAFQASPVAELIATDAAGNEFVAGSGSTCAEAWESAVYPDNWQRLACEVR